MYPDTAPLFVHRYFWRYTGCGGNSKYCIIENFSSQNFLCARRWWRYIVVVFWIFLKNVATTQSRGKKCAYRIYVCKVLKNVATTMSKERNMFIGYTCVRSWRTWLQQWAKERNMFIGYTCVRSWRTWLQQWAKERNMFIGYMCVRSFFLFSLSPFLLPFTEWHLRPQHLLLSQLCVSLCWRSPLRRLFYDQFSLKRRRITALRSAGERIKSLRVYTLSWYSKALC